MKFSQRTHLFVLLALTLWITPSQAQDAEEPTPPPGGTVIDSDELRSDQESHTSVFTGKVVVVGTNFKMTCQEMTVIFTKDGKIDTITAKGDVVITQPTRIAHCGQAQYFHDEDKFVLTDQPTILDNKNQISAPRIIMFRTKQTLITEGGRSTTIIANGVGSGAPAPAPDSTNPK